MALTDKEKKQRQRDRQKAMGMKNIEVTLSKNDREKAERNRTVRGGFRGPYEMNEYIQHLIRADTKALDKQLKNIGSCRGCRLELPHGCAGVCYGQNDCFHTRDARQLKI